MNIDFSQYQNWRQVKSPSGQTYYVVPGNEGYLYDPFLSQAKGRPILFQNPESALEEKRKADKKAEDAKSPVGQVLPQVAGTAGTLVGMHALNALGPKTAAEKLAEIAVEKALAEQAASKAATVAVPEIVSAEMVGSAGAEATPLATEGFAYGPAAAAAVGTYLAGKSAYDMATGKAKSWNKSSTSDKLGRANLALVTFGGSEIANKFLGGKSTKEIQADRWKALKGENYTGVNDYIDKMQSGQIQSDWKNDEFAKSRDESLLKAEDTWGSQDAIRAAGNDYFGTWDEDTRRRFNQEAINQGLFEEKKGGIYATDDQKLKELAAKFGPAAAMAAVKAQASKDQQIK